MMPVIPEKLSLIHHFVVHGAVGDASLAKLHPFRNQVATLAKKSCFVVSTVDQYSVSGGSIQCAFMVHFILQGTLP